MKSQTADATQVFRGAESRRPRRPIAVGGTVLGLLLGALVLLVGCGAESPAVGVTPGPTVGTHGSYAYLYSRVDYPLEVPVGSGDTVTLTLATNERILTVTPTAGSGATTVGAPIALPTDLQDYQDIAAEAEASAPANSPIVWQLVSPVRQSLLTAGSPKSFREYQTVYFKWHVQAVTTGQNLATITVHLYYVYLNGSEHPGTIEVTQDPIPIVAIAPAPSTSQLSQFKTPLVGLTGLAGMLGFLRFLWELVTNVKDAKEVAEAATKAAGKLRPGQGNGGRS